MTQFNWIAFQCNVWNMWLLDTILDLSRHFYLLITDIDSALTISDNKMVIPLYVGINGTNNLRVFLQILVKISNIDPLSVPANG